MMSGFEFSPMEIPVISGLLTAIVKCPVFITPGQFIRCFCFIYHATDGPILPSNFTAAIYSGTTIVNATPITTLNPVQWGRAGLGAFVFEYLVSKNASAGLYTIVFGGVYSAASFQISFPVRVVS